MRILLVIIGILANYASFSQSKQTKQLQSVLNNVWTDFRSYRGKIDQMFPQDTTFSSKFVIEGTEKAEIHNTIDQNRGIRIYIPAQFISTIKTGAKKENAQKLVDEWKVIITNLLGRKCIVENFSQERPESIQHAGYFMTKQSGYAFKTDKLFLLLQSSGKDDSFDVTLKIQKRPE